MWNLVQGRLTWDRGENFLFIRERIVGDLEPLMLKFAGALS
jgi:hypothetical protein